MFRSPVILARRLLISILMGWPLPLVCHAGAVNAAGLGHWERLPGGRVGPLAHPEGSGPGFTRLDSDQTGIRFTNTLDIAKALTNQVLFSGSGVAAGDIDGDGLCDLFFCRLDGPNALYRNLGGWRFEPVPEAGGAACADQLSSGAALADLDGDDDLDLLVTGYGSGVRAFSNNGQGTFREETIRAGLSGTSGGTTLALADIEGDGDLDLYLTNYRVHTMQDDPNIRFEVSPGTTTQPPRLLRVNGEPMDHPRWRNRYKLDPSTMRILEQGEPDQLYLNDGHGTFQPVPWDQGRFLEASGRAASTPYDWGLAAMFRDLNDDGAPDLYVCNDTDSEDRIWLNDGAGGFRAAPPFAFRHTSFSSMGVDVADIDRDGDDDLFVTDMLSFERSVRHSQMIDRRQAQRPGLHPDRPGYMQNTLFLNLGNQTYAEIAAFSGVDASDWSWTPAFLDVDLDGFEDLLITTGLERNFRDSDARRLLDQLVAQARLSTEDLMRFRSSLPRLDTPNYAFRNLRDRTFQNASALWRFDSKRVSQGMALADLDGDGDQDVLINCMNDGALVYRNDGSAPRLAIRLRGQLGNTRGIGARIRVEGGPVSQTQEMIAGGRYLSADDALRVFAAGSAESLQVEVRWRDGRVTRIPNAVPGRVYEVWEAAKVPLERRDPPSIRPVFEDVSHLLDHRHHDEPFDDFARQPLLSKRLSELGPGVAWFDLDGNGWDDLMIPGGTGGQLSLYLNEGGRFTPADAPATAVTNRLDQGMALAFAPQSGAAHILVSLSNYETGLTSSPAVLRYVIGPSDVSPALLPGRPASVGPIALGDLDADGDLDLFVGGRALPGRYPEPVPSWIYRQTNGSFVEDAANQPSFQNAGLVSAAMFSDLDGDGRPELVLACEWGPVRVFRNRDGQLEEATDSAGLASHLGWWNGVAAGDFDGDGRLDLVASNWGGNNKYRRYLDHPLNVCYGDLYQDGRGELVENHFDPFLQKVVPWRFWDVLSGSVPDMLERVASIRAYSRAGVDELLGDLTPLLACHTATVLDAMVFMNRGDRFEARPLPAEAQWSPSFGIVIQDFDGDGAEDIVLSQNFFGLDAETTRQDAGHGLWLRGDGLGAFTAVPPGRSGIVLEGEQRGAAAADFDRDGRVDLVMTQNGASTRLYRNQGAAPGFTVRLQGPAANPTAIGAQMRLVFDHHRGPARELRAGSGYWSQDSAVQVLAMPEPPRALWIRWPGGRETIHEIALQTRQLLVPYQP